MSTVTSTPGTVLRLKTRDEAGTDRDLPIPLQVQDRQWFSRKDAATIKTLAMEDFSQPGYGWTIKDLFDVGTDLTKRGAFNRVIPVPWAGRSGDMCLQIYGGDAANNPVAIDTKLSLPYEGAKKVGAEIIFGYLNQMLEEGCQLSLVVEQFDETNESRGQLRFTQNLNDLEYENSAGVFTLLDDNKKNSPLDSGNWGYMRLEVDFSKTPPAYIEAQLNDTVYTAVKDLAIRVAADTTAKKTGLELHLWNAATIVEGAEYFLRFFHLYRIL